jgi:hypothetical protein
MTTVTSLMIPSFLLTGLGQADGDGARIWSGDMTGDVWP